MKLRNIFMILGLSLFLVALVLFILSNNNKISFSDIMFPFSFGTVLAFSGACLITGELLAKIEALEKKTRVLEEELLNLKNNISKEK